MARPKEAAQHHIHGSSDRWGIRRCLFTGASLVALFAPQAAQAQEQAQEGAIDEIVVTAQRREEGSQDVPISIAVLGAEQIERANVQSVKDLVNNVSGVMVQDHYGTNTFYVIRGIGLNDFRSNSSPSAAVYVDEVYQSNMLAGSPPTFDIDRVEILKGPQGTLYGRNASSGAVNVITRRPTNEFDGYARLGYGAYGHLVTEGAFGGPISDQLMYRISAQADSYGASVFDNVSPTPTLLVPAVRTVPSGDAFAPEHWSVRGQLLWTPSIHTDILFGVHYSSRSGPTVNTIAIPTTQIPGSPFVCPGTNAAPDADRQGCRAGLTNDIFVIPPTGDREVSVNILSDSDATFWGASVRLDHRFDWATLTSITAVDGFNSEQVFDFDATAAEALNVSQVARDRAYNQELRLAGSNDSGMTWLIGLNAGYDNYREPSRIFFAGDLVGERGTIQYSGAPGRVAATSPHFATRATDANSLVNRARQRTWSYALFTDNELPLTDQLSLVAGYRFTYEMRKVEGSGNVTFNDGTIEFANQLNLGAANGFGGTVTTRSSGRIGLNWRPSENILGYVSFAESFKSGGFDAGFFNNIATLTVPYRPEIVRSVELGVKTDPLRNLRVNADVFYMNFEDPQARLTQFFNAVPQTFLSNLDEARVYGAEAEVVWLPFDGLTLGATATLLDTEVSQEGTGAATFDGRPLSHAPEQSFTLDGTYEFPIAPGILGRIQGDAKVVSSHFLRAEALPIDQQEGYTVVNGQIAIAGDDGSWDLTLWGRNLTDERYFIDAQAGFGAWRYNLGMPLTWGASATIRF